MSLATKYRPATLDEMLGQSAVIKILKQQAAKKQYTNCYLFTGPSGVGKTSSARSFSKIINEGKGSPIEIDAASNNGVDAIREIVDSARERAIDAEYKIFIIDEVHMLSQAAWNAFLKCLEEPPKYTIFMFCTTNPEKIPATIMNRVMRFNLSKIPTDQIKNRLEYICKEEGFSNYKEACDYIARLSAGGARDAIAMLEKAAEYNTNLAIENVLECLGNFSYDQLFDLTASLINGDQANLIEILEAYFNSGRDMRLFIDSYIDFTLNLCKYILFQTLTCTNLPATIKQRCDGYSQIPGILSITNHLLESMLDLKQIIKNDSNARDTVEIYFIKMMHECDSLLNA